jgi:hypothetical protein
MMTPALLSPSPTNRRTVLVALATILTVTAGTAPATAKATARPQSPSSNHLIRYEVSGGSGPAEYLTYEINYNQAHETNVRLPWSKQFSSDTAVYSFVVSAQGPGSLTCRILVDGRVVSQATASGQPARTVCVPLRS